MEQSSEWGDDDDLPIPPCGRGEMVSFPDDAWDDWESFFEKCKNDVLDVPPSCLQLLHELKTNDTYSKLSAEMCVHMIELLVHTHHCCVFEKCSSSNVKELLVNEIYVSTFGPAGKRRGEEHFELLEKMVPDLIGRCVDLRKGKGEGGESRQDDLDLKRKRFLIEDEKSSALSPVPILGNQNTETATGSSPVILTKKQVLSVSKYEQRVRFGQVFEQEWIPRFGEQTDHNYEDDTIISLLWITEV